MDKSIGITGFSLHDDKFLGNYRAKVEDNMDPLKLGRVRARVYPMFSSVEAEFLPWAVPAMALFEGAGVGIGSFCVPAIGTNVWVFFEMGDHNQPVYFAEAPDAIKGLPASIVTNYPNRKVFKTSGGIEIIVDDTALQIRVNHPTGTYILVDTTGKVTVSAVADAAVQSLTKVDVIAPIVNIDGKVTINSANDTLVQSPTKVDVIAPIVNLKGSTEVNINPV